MLGVIKGEINRIKETKYLASQKNQSHNWLQSVWNSVILILLTSISLSIFTMSNEAFVGLFVNNNIPFDLALLLIPSYFLFLFFGVMEKLIILHIAIFEKLSKTIFKLWQRMDMWYFRKYRKHSPLTDMQFKIQQKKEKLSKRKKKLITVLLIVIIFSLQMTLRLPAIYEDLPVEETKQLEERVAEFESQVPANELVIKVNG